MQVADKRWIRHLLESRCKSGYYGARCEFSKCVVPVTSISAVEPVQHVLGDGDVHQR